MPVPKQRMRLLISNELFYPAKLGGPANTLYWLAKSLASNGLEVVVVTTNAHVDEVWVESNKWIWIDNVLVRYCSDDFYCLLRLLWHNWREMRNCDAVILCDLFQKQIFITALMSRILHKRLIWSPRGELFASALGNSLIKRLYVRLVSICFGAYATFHATSTEEERSIRKYIGEDVSVINLPNYIDLPVKRPRNLSQPPYLLYMGRIAPIKALDCLIDGLSMSTYFMNSTYVFKIAGSTEDKYENYKKQLDEKIRAYGLERKILFIGQVSGTQKYQALADATALFLVSHSENFGNVVIESLSQGTPVVASKGTPWSSLVPNHAGYWIENTPDSIAQSVDQILALSHDAYCHLREDALSFGMTYDVRDNINKWIVELERLRIG